MLCGFVFGNCCFLSFTCVHVTSAKQKPMSCTVAQAGVKSYLSLFCYSRLTFLYRKMPLPKSAEILTLLALGRVGKAEN